MGIINASNQPKSDLNLKSSYAPRWRRPLIKYTLSIAVGNITIYLFKSAYFHFCFVLQVICFVALAIGCNVMQCKWKCMTLNHSTVMPPRIVTVEKSISIDTGTMLEVKILSLLTESQYTSDQNVFRGNFSLFRQWIQQTTDFLWAMDSR